MLDALTVLFIGYGLAIVAFAALLVALAAAGDWLNSFGRDTQ